MKERKKFQHSVCGDTMRQTTGTVLHKAARGLVDTQEQLGLEQIKRKLHGSLSVRDIWG